MTRLPDIPASARPLLSRSQGLTKKRENVVGGPRLRRARRLGVARRPDGLRAGLQQDHARLSGTARARGTCAGTARTGGTGAGRVGVSLSERGVEDRPLDVLRGAVV